jgi:predicted RNA-binding Zn-ribbon protein involved in translation (DUF1610 family)
MPKTPIRHAPRFWKTKWHALLFPALHRQKGRCPECGSFNLYHGNRQEKTNSWCRDCGFYPICEEME